MISTLLSIAGMRCPRCHKGKLFVNPNPFNFSTVMKMPEKCSCCEQATHPEPGFYYGAPYISYMLCIAIGFMSYFVFEGLLGIEGFKFLSLYALVLLLLWPLLFRYARVIFIHLFIQYDPSAAKCTPKTQNSKITN